MGIQSRILELTSPTTFRLRKQPYGFCQSETPRRRLSTFTSRRGAVCHTAMSDPWPTRLVALGNGVWLDEIRKDGHAPIKDVPGGSVTFATLGARMFVPHQPSSIAMTFGAGSDFENSVVDLFRRWSVDLFINYICGRPSARGIVFYEKESNNRESEQDLAKYTTNVIAGKDFLRLTEPIPVAISDLGLKLLSSRAFHFFGTAEYMEEQMADLARLRRQKLADSDLPVPHIIWEPHPKSCRPDTLEEHKRAGRLVDVFSPNHEELASFFFDDAPTKFDRSVVERQAAVFLDAGIGRGGHGCVVIRAAEHGCVVMSHVRAPLWLPSFYPPESRMVVDATGAGNAFLGAFAVGLQLTGSFVEAAMYGQVAASFTIEQVGLPRVSGEGSMELWNGCSVEGRLAEYRQRLQL